MPDRGDPGNRIIELGDDQIIVSRSDLAGRIVYVNTDFIEISGYSEAELIGQAHNIIRHPDVPAAVFADLWTDIADGRPWIGVIKNRCRNGDAYWVNAHVSPLREKGIITGYFSMRRKASAAQIAEAEATYAALREQGANKPVFQHGLIQPTGTLALFRKTFTNAPIALKLILSSLLVALVVLGTISLFLAQNVAEVLDRDARERLKHDVGLVQTAFSAQIEGARSQATDHGRTFFERMHWALGEKEPVSKTAIKNLAKQHSENQKNPIERFLPDLRTVATVLLRTPNGFQRVMSNVKSETGNSVIGTLLQPDHPAIPLLLAGETSTGTVRLFGRDYMTNYRPIIDNQGEVIGATFVGIDLADSMSNLKDKTRGLSVGKTGYYYVIDVTPGNGFGKVILHPFREGTLLPVITSHDGKNILEEMILKKRGELVYSWLNAEAGETTPRDKLVRFETLNDPHWVVAGGSALEEFTALSRQLAWSLVGGGLLMAAAIFLIMLWLLGKLVLKPLNTQVLPAFQSISSGNFTTQLEIHGEDEIAQVTQGLESLQNRLAFDNEQSQSLALAREAALHEAEALSLARAQFLANMSHEIRTPMNAVIGLAYLLLKGELGKREREYVSRIEGAGKLLLAIINDILDFSKIDAGEMRLEETGFHLDDILENLSMIVHDRVREKKLVLEYVVAPDVPQALRGDPLRLSQILINLVGNAIKFTSEGTVTVFINARSHDQETVHLDFSIQDTGIGMSPEQSSKLFQAFAQADSSVTRKYGGTGLGLVICKRLVELMGGQIQVDSQPNAGSIFSFSIALRKDVSEPNTPPLAAHHILVVDDNDLARTVLTRILQKSGCNVESSNSGDEALLALKNTSQPFDFVLLDLNMPGMNGLELAQHIRDDFARTPKLVLVTGANLTTEDDQDALGGFDAILEKPVTAAKISETLTRLSTSEEKKDSSLSTAAEQSLAGMRILVAEDVPTNQLIMRDLLESLGAIVTIADNGRLALEQLASKGDALDLILMDIQMPEMSGIEACQRIRAGQIRADIPIIALTANAMNEERQRCKEAGMNDFLTKPIEPQSLIETVARWRPKHLDKPTQPAPEKVVSASAKFPELPGIDVEDGLRRMMNRPAFFEKVLRDFHARFLGETERILAALAANETEEATRRAHSLKGLCGNIGATKLADLARELEFAIKESKPELDNALALVDAELAVVLDGIKQVFEIH
jgi:PAS domain S-box-containing protein